MKALAIFGSFRTAAAGLAGAFVFTVFRFSGNVFTSFTSGSLGIASQGTAAAAPMGTAEGQASALEAQASARSEEHTSELQSLMRISYAVFCLKKKKATQLY